MNLWSWLWTRDSEPSEYDAAMAVARERWRKLVERFGIFDNPDTPPGPLIEQLLTRVEDLERFCGGRERLRALRDWPKEKGVDD